MKENLLKRKDYFFLFFEQKIFPEIDNNENLVATACWWFAS
jgi:hypothetical protein